MGRIINPSPDPVVDAAIARQQRLKMCMADIEAALHKHGCILDVKCMLSNQGAAFQVNVLPDPSHPINNLALVPGRN
jgi:hypothetical protein